VTAVRAESAGPARPAAPPAARPAKAAGAALASCAAVVITVECAAVGTVGDQLVAAGVRSDCASAGQLPEPAGKRQVVVALLTAWTDISTAPASVGAVAASPSVQ